MCDFCSVSKAGHPEFCLETPSHADAGPQVLSRGCLTEVHQGACHRLDSETDATKQASGAEDKNSNATSAVKGFSLFEFPPVATTQLDVCPKV